MEQYRKLKLVKVVCRVRIPVSPYFDVFAQGSVSAAGNVCENTIKQEGSLFSSFLAFE